MGMGRDPPRAAGGMGLCKSKLPQRGRALRPQEKGNVAGGLAHWGKEGGCEGHEGGAGTAHPKSSVHTPPQPVIGAQRHMPRDQPASIHSAPAVRGSGHKAVNVSRELPGRLEMTV